MSPKSSITLAPGYRAVATGGISFVGLFVGTDAAGGYVLIAMGTAHGDEGVAYGHEDKLSLGATTGRVVGSLLGPKGTARMWHYSPC